MNFSKNKLKKKVNKVWPENKEIININNKNCPKKHITLTITENLQPIIKI